MSTSSIIRTEDQTHEAMIQKKSDKEKKQNDRCSSPQTHTHTHTHTHTLSLSQYERSKMHKKTIILKKKENNEEKQGEYVDGVLVIALANVVQDERLVELVELRHVVSVVQRLCADRINILLRHLHLLHHN